MTIDERRSNVERRSGKDRRNGGVNIRNEEEKRRSAKGGHQSTADRVWIDGRAWSRRPLPAVAETTPSVCWSVAGP